MKTILKLTVILLAVLLFTTCKKYPYYEEGVSFTTLLKSNTWKITESIEYNTVYDNNYKLDITNEIRSLYGDEAVDIYKSCTYTFDLDKELYTVLTSEGDTLYSEKSIHIKYTPEKKYSWEIQFDTIIYQYKFYVMASSDSLKYNFSNYWKVDYISSEKFQVSKTIYKKSEPTDSLKYTRVYEIIE